LAQNQSSAQAVLKSLSAGRPNRGHSRTHTVLARFRKEKEEVGEEEEEEEGEGEEEGGGGEEEEE